LFNVYIYIYIYIYFFFFNIFFFKKINLPIIKNNLLNKDGFVKDRIARLAEEIVDNSDGPLSNYDYV